MPGSGKPGYYLGKMEALRQEFGGRCQASKIWPKKPGKRAVRCNKREGLEFAHLKLTRLSGMGRGRADRYHEIKKNRELFALLCRQHHKQQEVEMMAAERLAAAPVFRESVDVVDQGGEA